MKKNPYTIDSSTVNTRVVKDAGEEGAHCRKEGGGWGGWGGYGDFWKAPVIICQFLDIWKEIRDAKTPWRVSPV